MVLQKHTDSDLDDSVRLWRYMDFDQFMHILVTQSLWLAPLSSMEDRREGKWIELVATAHGETFQQAYDFAASQTVISSWVAADHELLPMWESYTSGGTGIAVATDVRGLMQALAGRSITDDGFLLMRVQYRPSRQRIHLTPPTTFYPAECAQYKSKEFQHEREVRVVYSRSALHAETVAGVPVPATPGEGTHSLIRKLADLGPSPRASDPDHQASNGEVWLMRFEGEGRGTHHCLPLQSVLDYSIVPDASGTYIRIGNLRAFMKHGVYVSPKARPWLYDTVRRVIQNFGHDASFVNRSALTDSFQDPPEPPFQHAIRY